MFPPAGRGKMPAEGRRMRGVKGERERCAFTCTCRDGAVLECRRPVVQ